MDTSKFSLNGITGTATTMISYPFDPEGDESISVVIRLDRAIDGTRRWIFWTDLEANTVTISRSGQDWGLHEQVDVFRVDDFTGLEQGEIPTAEQMIVASVSWLEEQSAFD